MSLSARIQFGENALGRYSKEYALTACQCHFGRTYDSFSPDGEPRCRNIILLVVSPGMEDLYLVEWYVRGLMMGGRIHFEYEDSVTENGVREREIKFEDAICTGLSEVYDADTTSRRMLRLEITAGDITVDEVKFGGEDR